MTGRCHWRLAVLYLLLIWSLVFPLSLCLFSLYTTPLSKVMSADRYFQFHFNADWIIFLSITLLNCKNASVTFKFELKLNSHKTEFILFSSGVQHAKLASFPIHILSNQAKYAILVSHFGGAWWPTGNMVICDARGRGFDPRHWQRLWAIRLCKLHIPPLCRYVAKVNGSI